jgi:hypothetical protein
MRWRLTLPLAVVLVSPLLAVPSIAEPPPAVPAALPLGPAGLPETRTVQRLAPGVTLTTIVRGRPSAEDFWTVSVGLPVGAPPPSPDPDAPTTLVGSQEAAAAVAAQLSASGFTPRTEPVDIAALGDVPAGRLGYVVRVGHAADQTAATALAGQLTAAGFHPSVVFTGQDGTATTGPWVIRVLAVDPRRYRGTVTSTVGAGVAGRETTSQLADRAGALAAVNGGFFVISPADGVPGQPAGISVLGGRLETAATNGRVALVLGDGGRHTRIRRLGTALWLFGPAGDRYPVDGLNRPPGVIRNCGGDPSDQPTDRPLQDITCTDADELTAFTPQFGAALPAGPGLEAVLDPAGHVTDLRPRTAGTVPAGGLVVQGIGAGADWLAGHATPGRRLSLGERVTDGAGTVRFDRHDAVVNGGPDLVRDGRLAVDAGAEGMVHPGDPSFFYGWVQRRNPRTMAGVDSAGRLLLVAADGRQATASQGLNIAEAAGVMRALGAVDAMNLDGGGSTTLAVHSQVVNTPSDSTGERPVGDAIVLTSPAP